MDNKSLEEFRKFWFTYIFPQKGNVIGVKIKQSDKESNLEDVKKYGKKFEDFISKILNKQRVDIIKFIEAESGKSGRIEIINFIRKLK